MNTFYLMHDMTDSLSFINIEILNVEIFKIMCNAIEKNIQT